MFTLRDGDLCDFSEGSGFFLLFQPRTNMPKWSGCMGPATNPLATTRYHPWFHFLRPMVCGGNLNLATWKLLRLSSSNTAIVSSQANQQNIRKKHETPSGNTSDMNNIYSIYIYMYVQYIYIHIHIHHIYIYYVYVHFYVYLIFIYLYIYIYHVYIYICVCVYYIL